MRPDLIELGLAVPKLRLQSDSRGNDISCLGEGILMRWLFYGRQTLSPEGGEHERFFNLFSHHLMCKSFLLIIRTPRLSLLGRIPSEYLNILGLPSIWSDSLGHPLAWTGSVLHTALICFLFV